MIDSMDPALWATLLTITGIWSITVISPGPNFLATSHTAVTHSRRAGLIVALGIAVGTSLWASASLLGLGLLFQTAGWLYHLVRVAGAVYLIYIGLRMIFSAGAVAATTATVMPGLSGYRAFRLGLLTDLSNPKAAAFFTSLFAVTVPPLAPLWFDGAIIAIVVLLAGGWYAIVAWAMAAAPVAACYRRAQRVITYITGAIFITFGARLASDR